MDENRSREETIEIIKLALNETLDERKGIEAKTHAIDHQWIAAQRDKEKKRAQFYEEMTRFVIRLSVAGILTFTVSHLAEIFLWLSKLFKTNN